MGSQQLAVVKVGGEVMLTEEIDVFARGLAFLYNVGLFPVVVHGAGPQMNDEMARRGVEPNYVGGMRVTDEPTLAVARKIFMDVNLQLVAALESAGVPARPVTSGVFAAEQMDDVLGLVGSVTGVDRSAVDGAIAAGCVPVLCPLSESGGGQVLNVNADVAARELAMVLRPLKTIFISAKGGWLGEEDDGALDGKVVPTIDLRRDYARMAARDYNGRQGTLLKLNEIKMLMDTLPSDATVSITAAAQLHKELLSQRGAGTMFRHGEHFTVHSSMDSVDIDRLGELLSHSYGQQMFDGFRTKGRIRPDYIAELPNRVKAVYLSDSYDVGAIVTSCPGGTGVPYLCKFSVNESAQGTGVADAMWDRVRQDHPSLYWRSHSHSPINPWFFQRAEGMYRDSVDAPDIPTKPPWTVFWYGTSLAEEAVRDAAMTVGRSFLSAEELGEL